LTLVTLLGVLVLLATAAYAVFAAAGKPDFTVAATPVSQSVAQGAGTSYTAAVAPQNGFTGSVTLSVSGAPAGVTASVSPSSVNITGSASQSASVSVSVGASAAAGSYTLTVTGVSGKLSHSTTVTLVVQAAFSLSATPASQTVTAGGSTSYTVSLARQPGFTASVSLAASGLPAGATASFTPSSLSGTTTSSSMAVTTAGGVAAGSYTLTVTGSASGGYPPRATTVTLIVQAAASFTVSASPSSVTVAAGSPATYTVSLTRTNFTSSVSFSVSSGLPAGAAASFNPASTTGSSSTLTVNTANATTPDGSYTLTIQAVGGSLTRTTTVTLVVSTPVSGSGFTIGGSLSGLFYPGLSQPLNLSLTNPNSFDLSITNLTVSVQVVSAPNANATHPCSAADYTVQQFSAYPIRLLTSRTRTLSELGYTSAQWPQVTMLDTTSNQDGCKGASLKLTYTGTARKPTT
jgi:hypothetical protein